MPMETSDALSPVFPRPPFGFSILASNCPAFRSARSLMTVALLMTGIEAPMRLA
jgi:hypothetical protein